MVEMNRREFVVRAACAGCAAVMGCAGAWGEAKTSAGLIDAGEVGQFSKAGASEVLLKKYRIFLVTQDKQLFAVDAHCTHRGCVVKLKGDEFACPCHGSVYTLYGTVDQGPAEYSLLRYGISLSEEKHVMVDMSKEFDERDWGKKGAFIAMG